MAILKKPVAKPAAKPAVKAPVAKTAVKATAKPATSDDDAPPVKKAFPAKRPPAGRGRPAGQIKPTWDAPSDFKPAFFAFRLKTDRWGLVDTRSVFGERIRGRWDNPDAKRFDMAEYDVATLRGFAMIVAASTYAPNPARRLPPNQPFLFIVRASKAAETGIVRARLVAIATKTKADKKLVWFEDKKDPLYRRLRRANRCLPSAFVDAQLPPTPKKKTAEDAED